MMMHGRTASPHARRMMRTDAARKMRTRPRRTFEHVLSGLDLRSQAGQCIAHARCGRLSFSDFELVRGYVAVSAPHTRGNCTVAPRARGFGLVPRTAS